MCTNNEVVNAIDEVNVFFQDSWLKYFPVDSKMIFCECNKNEPWKIDLVFQLHEPAPHILKTLSEINSKGKIDLSISLRSCSSLQEFLENESRFMRIRDWYVLKEEEFIDTNGSKKLVKMKFIRDVSKE